MLKKVLTIAVLVIIIFPVISCQQNKEDAKPATVKQPATKPLTDEEVQRLIDIQTPKNVEIDEPKPPDCFKLIGKFSLGSTKPVFFGNLMIIQTSRCFEQPYEIGLVCIDTNTNKIVWKLANHHFSNIEREFEESEVLITSSAFVNIRSGKIISTFERNAIHTVFLIRNDMCIYKTGSSIICLDFTTRKQRWFIDAGPVPGPGGIQHINMIMATKDRAMFSISNGVVGDAYLVPVSSKLFICDLKTGKETTNIPYGTKNKGDQARAKRISPALALVFVYDYEKNKSITMVFDVEKSKQVWVNDQIPFNQFLYAGKGSVYLAGYKTICKLDEQTGNVVWSQQLQKFNYIKKFILSNGECVFLVSTSDGSEDEYQMLKWTEESLITLDDDTGKLIAKKEISNGTGNQNYGYSYEENIRGIDVRVNQPKEEKSRTVEFFDQKGRSFFRYTGDDLFDAKIIDGLFYLLTQTSLTCYDLNGRVIWKANEAWGSSIYGCQKNIITVNSYSVDFYDKKTGVKRFSIIPEDADMPEFDDHSDTQRYEIVNYLNSFQNQKGCVYIDLTTEGYHLPIFEYKWLMTSDSEFTNYYFLPKLD